MLRLLPRLGRPTTDIPPLVLQVASRKHQDLQPRADYAQCCCPPLQPGCQDHEGEADLLRYGWGWSVRALCSIPQLSPCSLLMEEVVLI